MTAPRTSVRLTSFHGLTKQNSERSHTEDYDHTETAATQQSRRRPPPRRASTLSSKQNSERSLQWNNAQDTPPQQQQQYHSEVKMNRPGAPPGRGVNRYGSSNNNFDDGIRIYSRENNNDGIRVRNSPPPPDASNTARIIARRRAGGGGPGRGGGGAMSVSGGRGGGMSSGQSVAHTVHTFRPKRGDASVASSRRAPNSYRRPTDGSGNTHGTGPGQPRRRTTLSNNSCIEGGLEHHYENNKSIPYSKSTASELHRLKELSNPAKLKRSNSYDNFDVPAYHPGGNNPRAPPNRQATAPPQLNRQQRFMSRDQHGISDITDNQGGLKLYDEILSASNPNIPKYPENTLSTLPSDVHSALQFNMNSYEKKPRIICSTRAIIGLAVLVLGLGGAGAALYVLKPWDSDSDDYSADEQDSTLPAFNPAPTASPKKSNVIKPPPIDIEGRCSPSNLPGSLSVCLSACIPSSCCYPDYSGDMCNDSEEGQEACMAYRPYCDVFYDAWNGGTEGVLRPVSEDMIRICTGTGDRSQSDAEYSITGGNDGYTRKRVRGHVISHLDRELSRKLESAEVTCSLYCASAKCCSASIVTDPQLFGLNRTPSGVYIDASNGEYISTNCQESNADNVEICTVYQTFCTDNTTVGRVPPNNILPPTGTVPLTSSGPTRMPSSLNEGSGSISWPFGSGTPNIPSNPPNQMQPSFPLPVTSNPAVPGSQLSPAPNVSPLDNQAIPPYNSNLPIPSPLIAPSTQNPTDTPVIQIPPASIEQIQQACSNPVSVNSCIRECNEGLCCVSSQLGYTWIQSCLVGNEEICAGYSLCSNLSQDSTGTPTARPTGAATASPSTSPTSTSPTKSPIQNGPPLQDLSMICSLELISMDSGLNQCITACAQGLCCGATGESSCYDEYTETCTSYLPCNAAYEMLTRKELPPAADENLGTACSFTFLSQKGTSQCIAMCEPGSCCADGSCLNEDDRTPEITNELNGICGQYSACNNLGGMPPPPNNIAQICSTASNQCTSICSTVSCCFQNQASSCYSLFASTCEYYRPFCAPTPSPTPYPTNPPTVMPTPMPTLQPITQEPSSKPTNPLILQPVLPNNTGGSSANSIPDPPSDLQVLCTVGPSVFCRQVCQPAQCCFETSFQLNCFAQNEICRDYAACSSLYEI